MKSIASFITLFFSVFFLYGNLSYANLDSHNIQENSVNAASSTDLPKSTDLSKDLTALSMDKIVKVNINLADATEISAAMAGVGLKKAQKIIDYREQYGKFTQIEQLAEVSGISEKIVQKNMHLIEL